IKKHNYMQHKDFSITGCSETEKESMTGSDGQEAWHADFNQKTGVVTLPDFADPMSFPGYYEESVAEQDVCKQNLAVLIKLCVFTDPPETFIYSRNDVQLAVENTLICHVTDFFPPPVSVSWAKNNVIVTEDVSLSQYRPRSDGSFHVFSSLKITPEDGDVYSCTVNHQVWTCLFLLCLSLLLLRANRHHLYLVCESVPKRILSLLGDTLLPCSRLNFVLVFHGETMVVY
uniref:Zgc:123107 n=1 Tax=Sinocyclocheilus grahami TaxID=75366 RepID=A0A672M0Y9_SINGR